MLLKTKQLERYYFRALVSRHAVLRELASHVSAFEIVQGLFL